MKGSRILCTESRTSRTQHNAASAPGTDYQHEEYGTSLLLLCRGCSRPA
jgi:hypothetical protein